MTGEPVIFAGPSLYGVTRDRLHGVDLRPPAGKGDLLAAAMAGVPAIGLIDGTFEYGAAVWHKEILWALDRGIPVLGAASMGALRGAECAAFGMIGIGTVYADYADGHRQSDADVAVVHAPAALGYRPLTEALVDIDATLVHLRALDEVTEAIGQQLAASAKTLHFKQRSWAQIVAHAGYDGPAAAAILKQLRSGKISAKTTDALALVDAIRSIDLAARGSRLTGALNRTLFYQSLEQEMRGKGSAR